MKKLLVLALAMIISGGNVADIGEVADCGRSGYQELAPAPTTEPVASDLVAPYLTPDATPCPALDNTPEAPSETECNSPSHNEMENTPALTANNAPAALTEEDDNQPSHYDAPVVPTNGPVETPHLAPDSTPMPPAETANNTPAHNNVVSSDAGAGGSNSCPEALTSVAEVMANDASNVNTHCDMPTE